MELTYKFEELPLTIIEDRECVMVNGEVDVEYSTPSDWHIAAIALDGWKQGSGFKTVTVPPDSLWYEIVRAAVLTHCSNGIRCAIMDDMNDYRATAHLRS